MNKVMIVTGASRGIGAATARLAAARGYAVCVNYYRHREAADAVVGAIERAGGRAIAMAADVASETDVERLFQTVDQTWGPVTALVNNAGILERQIKVEAVDAARLNRIFATNVTGCFLCARGRRCGVCPPGVAAAVERLSTFHRGRRAWVRRGSMWITRPPKGPSIR